MRHGINLYRLRSKRPAGTALMTTIHDLVIDYLIHCVLVIPGRIQSTHSLSAVACSAVACSADEWQFFFFLPPSGLTDYETEALY